MFLSIILFQFRALADQLYQNSDCHELVRQEIVKQVISIFKLLIVFFIRVLMSYDD